MLKVNLVKNDFMIRCVELLDETFNKKKIPLRLLILITLNIKHGNISPFVAICIYIRAIVREKLFTFELQEMVHIFVE